MVKVSVLMPVYKTDEAYLRAAIESILSQTYTDFEFLIIDDCPTDDRSKIVQSYQDKRIRYIKNDENMGISRVRNKLIDLARGEYLAIFDHDDISLPNRLELEVAYLDAHPDVGVVGAKSRNLVAGNVSAHPSDDHDIKVGLMRVCTLVHSASMVRKSVLIQHNIRYEEKFSPAEDYALYCRLIPYTKFHNLDEELFHYRDHAQNTSHLQAEKMALASFAIQSFAAAQNPDLYREFWLKSRQITRIRLFGRIPFLKRVRQAGRVKTYLFEKILLFTSKATLKLSEAK